MWGIQVRASGAQNRDVTVAGAHRGSPEECRGNKPTARKDGERGPLVVQVRASGMRDVVTGTWCPSICDTQPPTAGDRARAGDSRPKAIEERVPAGFDPNLPTYGVWAQICFSFSSALLTAG